MSQEKAARILVVDDEPENCFVASRALEEKAFKVSSAFSGEEALAQLAEAPFDLVLLDIRMPGMDGIEVLSRIRERDKDIAVIIISAFENVNAAVKCMRMGAYDYLTKPINIEELRITVANALRTRKLEQEVHRLQTEIEKSRGLDRLVGESPAIQKVASLIHKVAEHEITVLLTGESGTGKEVVAEAIHQLSRRKAMPFVSVDCAALPEHLVESELFGYEKGAFTGALDRKPGRFELAHGGVLFLDEIGNLPVSVQIKLLRVLQEREVQRLGSKSSQHIDVRVIAATNVDFKAAIRKGDFREDLYFRLAEFNIHLPALREREGDVLLLANYFLHRFNSQFGRKVAGFSPEAQKALRACTWPGNVRQLQNAVKRAVIMAEDQVALEDLPPEIFASPVEEAGSKAAPDGGGEEADLAPGEAETAGIGPLKEASQKALAKLEKDLIEKALKATRWNKAKAAKMLEVDYKTLYNKIKEYGIE